MRRNSEINIRRFEKCALELMDSLRKMSVRTISVISSPIFLEFDKPSLFCAIKIKTVFRYRDLKPCEIDHQKEILVRLLSANYTINLARKHKR